MLILSLILLGSYFVWTFFLKKFIQTVYLKQGGKQLINQAISLTNVSSYLSNNKLDYQYALSFWFYLDAFSPSAPGKISSILSYGENPSVNYSSANNTLYITVHEGETPDTSSFKENTFNKNQQKQNNTINDIELVKSIRNY
jgi:hypothetical protein